MHVFDDSVKRNSADVRVFDDSVKRMSFRGHVFDDCGGLFMLELHTIVIFVQTRFDSLPQSFFACISG